MRRAFRAVRQQRSFRIEAIVVLPDHLHTVWTLPEGDNDYPGRWRAIKSRFTRAVKDRGVSLDPNAKGEYGLWRRRHWEHTIRNDEDLQRHVDYIHFNAVKHGLVRCVSDLPHSSFHYHLRRGRVSRDWAGTQFDVDSDGYGE